MLKVQRFKNQTNWEFLEARKPNGIAKILVTYLHSSSMTETEGLLKTASSQCRKSLRFRKRLILKIMLTVNP